MSPYWWLRIKAGYRAPAPNSGNSSGRPGGLVAAGWRGRGPTLPARAGFGIALASGYSESVAPLPCRAPEIVAPGLTKLPARASS